MLFLLTATVLLLVGSAVRAFAATPTTTYRQDVLASSPVSYWRLGETSGTTAIDELGRNNGTYSNISLNQPGALACDTNASVSLNGTSGYMTVPSSSSLNLTSGVTVEFWLRRAAVSGRWEELVGKPGNLQSKFENYAVWLDTHNKIEALFGDGTNYVSASTSPIRDTNWHYIVATSDGSTAKIYLDGLLKQSTSMGLSLTGNSNPLNLGRANANTNFFNGRLDEVAIYSSALSATTVQSHYAKGTTDLVPPCFTLAAPASGGTLSSPAVTFSGQAGSATGDSSKVTVNVYSGPSASGTPAQTLTATRQAGSYVVTTNLPNGTWSAQAQQSNTAGFTGYSSANTFVVNSPPPAPTITSAPPDPSNSSSASFAFSDSQTGVSFACSLDGSAFSSCTSPQSYTGLADGGHTLRVQASDATGNTSGATAYSWTVDTTPPPAPTLTGAPPDPSSSSSASFSFSDNESGVGFECALDGAAFTSCTSPRSYSGLANGGHSFQVKAVDSAGNRSSANAYSWTVDAAAPTVTLTSPGNGSNPLEWPTFRGSGGTAPGDSSTLTVKVYTGSSASGTPLQTLTASVGAGGTYSVAAPAPLNPGTYTAQAEQTNVNGGTGLSSANTFTVGDPVVLAAGSIASCSDNGASRTKNLLAGLPDAMVLTLGNAADDDGSTSDYQNCYDPHWGFALPRTRPVPGSHDMTNGGSPPGVGYATYFANQLAPLGPTASDLTKLYYSYDLGAWHIVALNDLCNDPSAPTPGCDEAAQEQWLRNDLAAHTNQCVLALSNRPRWSSDSLSGNRTRSAAFWSLFYQYGVDLVLNGATHHYERFAPQDPDGNLDPTYGVREIISGHGGAFSIDEATPQPNSVVYDNTSYGVLKVALHANGYDWQFLPVADGLSPAGGSFTDSGSATCHDVPPALTGPYRDEVLAASPISYWRLGETSGTTAADELATNPGTYSNVLLNQPGALAGDSNPSASFNGSSSYLTVPSSTSLNMTSAVSVEFWAKRRTISSNYQVLVGKPGDGASQNENYGVWLTTSNKYTAYFGNGSSYVAVQTPAITDTNWHYVAATNDNSTARIYLDGVLVQSAPMTVRLTANTRPLNIGRANNNSYFFNGWLDEVALYPTALSATTTQAHYMSAIGS